MSQMYQAAFAYLMDGRSIFPVCTAVRPGVCKQHGDHEKYRVTHKLASMAKAGKHPLVRWKPYQEERPTDEEVAEWWTRWPDANIGMATGRVSGVVVLDADGDDARRAVLQKGGIDQTPVIWTGRSGGAHFWLAAPTIDVDVRNFAGKLPGVDFRGEGGYALLPPSVHELGTRYRWADRTQTLRPVAMPQWLLDLFDAPSGTDTVFEPLDTSLVLDGIPEGQRDDMLWRYCGKLVGDGVPFTHAETLIRQAARLCRPPFDEDTAVEKLVRAYRQFSPNQTLVATTKKEVPAAEPFEWTVYDAADFLSLDIPPVLWLVEGYVREAAVIGNFGAPGGLKTYLGTQIALCIATGRSLFDQFSVVRGRVLIVQEDTLASDYQQAYLRPMCAHLGITDTDLRGWLFVAPPAEMLLDVPEKFAALERWIDEHRPSFVLLDSFYLFHQTNGFTPEELTPILRLLKALRIKYGCTIWLIDHDRKTNKSANGSENAIDRWMGGRAKSAACEAAFESVPGENGTVTLYARKLRGGAFPKPLTLTYENGALVADITGEESLQNSAHMLYRWMMKEGGSRTVQQMEQCGLRSTALHMAMNELRRAGLIKHTGNLGRAKCWVALSAPDVGEMEPELVATWRDE